MHRHLQRRLVRELGLRAVDAATRCGLGKNLMLLVRDEFAIGEIDGEPAAMVVTLPNINEAIADLDGRLLPFGWAKLLWRLKVKGLAQRRACR